jgi:hypothetical protein
MKRITLVVLVIVSLLLPAALAAQMIVDDANLSANSFERNWNTGSGDWRVYLGGIRQDDTENRMARIDRRAAQSGNVEISFTVRYRGGGLADGIVGQYHAGFGVHLGVDSLPPRVSWGANDSYLLWLNLDTRRDTRMDASEHYGFRGQVYRAPSNSQMSLTGLNVDLISALNSAGIDFSVNDLTGYLNRTVPIRIRVNYDTGRVMVNDPTAPSTWFWFDLDPAVLDGSYMSLRTNSLSVSFSDITVRRL